MTKEITIRPLDWMHVQDVYKPKQSFKVYGRLIPEFKDDKWVWKEELFENIYDKDYPGLELDYSQYINSRKRAIFLAYIDNECVGRIILRENWNKYCYVEDIAVARDYRRMGIGKKLIETAVKWAKEQKMPGFMLETQDVNLAACKLYASCGFILGGVDTMLYGNGPNKGEKALFWYMKFE